MRILAVVFLLVAAGCASSRGVIRTDAADASPPEMIVRQSSAETPAGAPSVERLLIRRAELELVAPEPASLAVPITDITQASGGYVESSLLSEGRILRMSLRVPSPALETTLMSLSALAEVERRQISAQDVTEQIFDLEARLQNLRAVRDRLRQYVDRASAVRDIIEVERELTRVQGEIEVLEGRLTRLRSDTALSQISVEVHRRRILGPLGAIIVGTARLISKLFVIQ